MGLAAISYDPPAILDAFSRRYSITYPLLSDVGSATIQRYGILNTVADDALGAGRDDETVQADVRKFISVTGSLKTAGLARGTPFPGTFVVDRNGVVVSRHFEEFYRERITVSSILVALGGSRTPVNATRITADHLEFTTYPTDTTVVPGTRFSLVVNVLPRPGTHVYAPGATGYRPVSLRIPPIPFVRALPARYPASEIYFFKPLNERVPVYQRPFTLVQDVVVEATPEAERTLRKQKTIEIDGIFEYQACDDKVCFNPVSIPLSWTLALASHQ